MNYLTSLNYALKMVKTINFMLFVFYHNKKKNEGGGEDETICGQTWRMIAVRSENV